MSEKQKQYDRNRTNSVSLNFKVNKRTAETLERIAEQKGVSKSEICRQQLEGLAYQPPLFDKKDSDEMKLGLQKLGNNLNQAVKNLNNISNYFQKTQEKEKVKLKEKERPSIFKTPPYNAETSSSYQLFQDSCANAIAEKLQITNIEGIFLIENQNNFRFSKLTEHEVAYFSYFISNNKRPPSKEEYNTNILVGLKQSLEIIQEFKKDSKKIWELL